MNIKKYATHSDFEPFGFGIVHTNYPPKENFVETCLENISPVSISSLNIDYKMFLECDLVILLCSVYVGSISTSCFSRKLSISGNKAYNFIHMAGVLDIPLLAIPINEFTNDEQCMFYPNHFIIPEDELQHRLKEYNLNQDSKVIVFISDYSSWHYIHIAGLFRYILEELRKYEN